MNDRQQAFLTKVVPMIIIGGALGLASSGLSAGGSPIGSIVTGVATMLVGLVIVVLVVRWSLKYPPQG